MWLRVLAVLSGVSFSVIGVSYRLGQPRGIRPMQIAAAIGLAGVIFFGVGGIGLLGSTPGFVLWLALAAGVAQYLAFMLVRTALAMGPLGPLWCAISLGFVPAVVYARLGLGEVVTWTQYAGVAAGILCVLVASAQQRGEDGASEAAERRAPRRQALYALVLLLTFLFNGITCVAIKDLSARAASPWQSYMQAWQAPFMFVLYAAIAVLALSDVFVRRVASGPRDAHGRGEPAGTVGWWAALGLLAGAGSVGGMWALSVASVMPGALVFTVSNISSIIAGSVLSVVLFKEKARAAWFAMVGLGVLAAALVYMA